MSSLIELVDRVNKAQHIEPVQLEIFQNSANSAESYLAHRAAATMQLRGAHEHLRECLEAINFSDRKLLEEYLIVCEFLDAKNEQSEPTARFGAAALARGEISLGIEAIQSAVAGELKDGGSFLSDRENCLWIASQYARAAKSIGWATPEGLDWGHDAIRLGYIVSEILDESEHARILTGLAESLDLSRCEFYVYSTEAAVYRGGERFTQPAYSRPSAQRQATILRKIQESGAGVWLAPCDGDALSAAGALAEKMVLDQIDAAIFDVTQADAVAAIVASWPVARAKINWCRTTPFYAPKIDAVIYGEPDQHAADKDFWAERGIESRFIFEGFVPEPLRESAPVRAAWGIPQSAVVLATTGRNLEQKRGGELIDTIIEALRIHRQAICLILGPGEFSTPKRQFERAGVSGRIGYAANVGEVLGISDIYLAESRDVNTEDMLLATGMGKPVLIGELGPRYSTRLARLIQQPEQRRILGQTMRRIAREQFSMSNTAQRLLELCSRLLGRKETAAGGATDVPMDATAKVA